MQNFKTSCHHTHCLPHLQNTDSADASLNLSQSCLERIPDHSSLAGMWLVVAPINSMPLGTSAITTSNLPSTYRMWILAQMRTVPHLLLELSDVLAAFRQVGGRERHHFRVDGTTQMGCVRLRCRRITILVRQLVKWSFQGCIRRNQ